MEEKIFFMPGDVVTLKQNIDNKPLMIVVRKETMLLRVKDSDSKDDYFKGIRCKWFSTMQTLHEAVFNTKDLVKIK